MNQALITRLFILSAALGCQDFTGSAPINEVEEREAGVEPGASARVDAAPRDEGLVVDAEATPLAEDAFNCESPGLRPSRGSSAGGDWVDIVGYQPYIGALSDWIILGDQLLSPAWRPGASVCGLGFVTPPHAPGPVPVWAFYGEPEQIEIIMESPPLGVFTFLEDGTSLGEGDCVDDAGCEPPFEVCDLGLGRCVTNVCVSAHCSEHWSPGLCDSIMGCVDGCANDADCKLIYASCGCQAVPLSDPRVEMGYCGRDTCEVCPTNHCMERGISAVCREGVCTEE